MCRTDPNAHDRTDRGRTNMADGVLSVWVSIGLMLAIAAFGQLMIEVKPQKCPWEPEGALAPDNVNFEVKSRHDWKGFKPAWSPDDLHHVH